MMSRREMDNARPGDTLLVIHEFNARSPDELSFKRGDRIELIERDDDFGDGWFLGRHKSNGDTGLFPEVYTQLDPRSTPISQQPTQTLTQKSSEPILGNLERQDTGSSEVDPLTPVHNDTAGQRSSSAPIALQPGGQPSSLANKKISIPSTTQRGLAMGGQASPVMNETLSVIDEHLTDIHTPRTSLLAGDRRGANDSSSEYSSHVDHRLSYINGQETDEEEQILYTLAEVRSWSPERVAEWLEDVGVEKRHCNVFREQEISGEVLLSMDQQTLFMKEFDLGPIGPRLRIWQKIKALQQEVGELAHSQAIPEYSASDRSVTQAARHRSSSIGTVLPRIPSLMESKGARPSSRQQLSRASSQQQSSRLNSLGVSSGVPSSPGTPVLEHSRRPSAASIRELNQHRRHSSIEFAAEPATPTSANVAKPLASTPTSHKKIPSFDRGWTMGEPKSSPRPASSAQMRAMMTDDESPREVGLTVVTPNDLDRGYFSGNEVDTRKQRNVLRKGHSPSHSRTGSFGADGRRLSAFGKRHSKMGSSDSSRDIAEPTISENDLYPNSQRSKSPRAASGPELRVTGAARVTKDRSKTVTKLEYGTPSIDAIASSPNLAGSDTESNGRASPPPAIARFPKQRATGLRAISDAISGNMLSLGSIRNAPASPVKESPSSPVRTGSSTPSATSKSFESNETPAEVSRAGTGASMTPSTGSSGTGRRKSKKETSAYQRGLENKTPQEQMEGADYTGWMKKRSSNIMTTWKTRLFVLRGRRLSYYYSEFDTAEKGLIDISGHRVLPANNERITGIHAAVTGAKSSPTSPQNASLPTSAATDAANALDGKDDTSGMFIFKLVPPRSGLSKAVNFTKPTVHYFAVDNLQQGRLWMAALMKATIDRDDTKEVVSTYQQKTISLAKARAMQQRPPELMGDDDDEEDNKIDEAPEEEDQGLAITGLESKKSEPSERSGSVDASDATTGAAPESTTTTSVAASDTENKE